MPFYETSSGQIQQTGSFAYGLLDLSKDQEFQFSENPKVVHQADKAHHKKPGRKPLTNIPDSKRKAQILTAQRAFRDRKKCYVEDLENKVKDCEHSHSTTITSLQRELMELKERLARVEKENQTLKKVETAPTSNCCSSNPNYLLPTISNCSEAFRGLPAQFEYTQFPTLSSSTVSNQNQGVPSIPEMGYPQFEDSYQRFPISNSYGNVDFVPAGTSRVNILSGNLHSEPAHLSDSDPSTHSLSDIPKTPNDLRGTLEYTNSQYDPPFYHLDASTSPPSSVPELSNNISKCNGCNSPELNPQCNGCNSPELNPQCNGCNSPELNPQCNGCDSPEPKSSCNGCNSPGLKPQCSEYELNINALTEEFQEPPKISCGCEYEVPCIPKSPDEAALCESLTCVAIGVPATTVSTSRLVLEVDESESTGYYATKCTAPRKYIGARDVWEKFSAEPEFAHLSVDSLCKQLKSKIKVLDGCNGEKRHVIIPEDEVTAAFERLHLSAAK